MLSVDDYLHDGESVCIGRKGTIDNQYSDGKVFGLLTLCFTLILSKAVCQNTLIMFFQKYYWLRHNEAGGGYNLSRQIYTKLKL